MEQHTTSSPLRKKSRQFNNESTLHNSEFTLHGTIQTQPSLSVGFNFASSSWSASTWSASGGASICMPAISKDDNASATAEVGLVSAETGPATEETGLVAAGQHVGRHVEMTHHVEMTLFGAVCFHPGCMTKLGTSIHAVSEKTLREHFDTRQCHTGRRPDCTNLVRKLKHDLATLKEFVLTGGALADDLVERVLPANGVTRTKGSYCVNCGLIGKPSLLKKQHFTEKNKKCGIHHLRRDTMVKSSVISNMKIPEEIAVLIRLGKFSFCHWNDPQKKRIERRMQFIDKLSCVPADKKEVSICPPLLPGHGHLNIAQVFFKGASLLDTHLGPIHTLPPYAAGPYAAGPYAAAPAGASTYLPSTYLPSTYLPSTMGPIAQDFSSSCRMAGAGVSAFESQSPPYDDCPAGPSLLSN
ncbi:hypothetical protein THAOC_12818 [Thalassiosira oceanica]|uniref:Uncharacterized protein n=1 Tax=Thalassiosira oceanica TaxID=159749 RepID=K0SJ82_THAOC|nr:hypothetical protein THAOC_12818 [Thalassiosira oceanica]|eukprot:EJK66273.1 hypothetical protein THAOC_12818 [Thalassiosira oceanica]